MPALFELATVHLTCENLMAEVPRQPFNTYSNIGYFAVAGFLFAKAVLGHGRIFAKFGALSFWIGCASVLAHALMLPFFFIVDYASILFFILYLAGFNPQITGRFPGLRSIGGKMSVVAVYSCLQPLHRVIAPAIFLLTAFIFIGMEGQTVRTRKLSSQRLFFRGILTFLAGFVFLALDVFAPFCAPDQHAFQLHGVWHVGSAASIGLISFYYRSKVETDYQILPEAKTGVRQTGAP